MTDQVTPVAQPEQTAAPALTLRFEFSPQGIGTLFGALAKAQKAFKPVKKTSKNPFYKSNYADLAEVLEATRDGLADNGIAVVQPPCYRKADGTAEIHTFMGHSSGEWMHSILEMPVSKIDAQAVGSAITYGRRYAYSGTVNVASEDDDDGNAAISKEYKKPETNEEFDQRTVAQMCIGPEQILEIDKALKNSGKTEEEIIAALGFIGEKRIEHIKKNQFDKFLKWALGIKKATMKPASQISPPKEDQRAKANKRLWATAAELSIPEKDVKTFAYEKFGVDSMTGLSEAQLDQTTDWIKEVARAVSES